MPFLSDFILFSRVSSYFQSMIFRVVCGPGWTGRAETEMEVQAIAYPFDSEPISV